MSKAVHRRVMESSVPLELTPGTGGVGNSSTPGSSLRKEKPDHRLLGPQGQAHLNGCVPLSHQVAGHKYGVDKVGILQHPDGTVLKQVQPPPRGPREMQFYGMVFAEGCSDPCLLNLQNHIPKYYGTWASPDSCSDSELYLKLEDVTSRFVRPCIMDVKLGQRSYDPFASQEKREQQIRKYPLMEEIGFLILGMRVYNVRSDSFDSYDQHYGRSLDKDTVKDGLARFFHNGVYLRKDAIWASIHRVQKILHWFYSQNQLAFFASSLLFVYEGLPSSSCFSFFRNAPVSDTVMTTGTLLLGDGGQSHEMTAVKEGPRQEKEVVENNNNTEEPVSWDHSPTSVYTGQRNFCGSGRLLKNSGDYVATQKMTTSDLEDRASALYEGDNTCQRTCEQKPPTNGNKGKNADGEREKSSRMEEEGLKALGRGGGGEDNMEDLKVEVKMIDFAHVFPSDSHDQGYIYGLKHLVTVLEQILCDAAQSSLSPSTS